MQTSDEYQATLEAFSSGKVFSANRMQLETYLIHIAQNKTGDDEVQARDIVQALTINHLILQKHIDELEKRGSTTQFLMILLTIATLLSTIFQAYISYTTTFSVTNNYTENKKSSIAIKEEKSKEVQNPNLPNSFKNKNKPKTISEKVLNDSKHH